MCCAVQFSHFENFFTQDLEAYPSLDKIIAAKENGRTPFSKKAAEMKDTCVEKKTIESKAVNGDSVDEEGGKKKKKKKKWKKLSLSDTGFNLSMFPRPCRATADPEEEERIFQKVEHELEIFEQLLDLAEGCHNNETVVFDGTVSGQDKCRRRDRDRKVRKAGKQVKDKYCSSVKNNNGRKKLFINHRLFKLVNLEVRKMTFLPSPKHYSRNIINNKSTNETRSKLKTYKPAPVQNLRHTLHETNAPTEMESNLINILISLQHRDLTPEDYDLLLQLDESVAPKTIDKAFLSSFKTDTVTEETCGDLCPVCMDPYEVGQNRKYLPCNHVFHANCIDMWLENSSRNCPVDGLPVEGAS